MTVFLSERHTNRHTTEKSPRWRKDHKLMTRLIQSHRKHTYIGITLSGRGLQWPFDEVRMLLVSACRQCTIKFAIYSADHLPCTVPEHDCSSSSITRWPASLWAWTWSPLVHVPSCLQHLTSESNHCEPFAITFIKWHCAYAPAGATIPCRRLSLLTPGLRNCTTLEQIQSSHRSNFRGHRQLATTNH